MVVELNASREQTNRMQGEINELKSQVALLVATGVKPAKGTANMHCSRPVPSVRLRSAHSHTQILANDRQYHA
jgi:hypothetical protein